MEQVTVFLTPIDAEAFQLFQKHFVAFKMLESIGAFGIKSGSLTLNFDGNGHVASVDKQQHFKI